MTVIGPRQADIISEKELLATVLELADAYGWMCFHIFETRRHARVSSKGFPDLVLGRRINQEVDIIVAELKSESGSLSPEQRAWRDIWQLVSGVPGSALQYYLWRPSDLLDGTIERVLAS